jgi:hypothetical protein
MMTSRRNFLEELLAAGILTGALSSVTLSDSLMDSSAASPDLQVDSDVHAFWNNFFESVGPNSRGKSPLDQRDRKVQYLHFNEGKGLRYLSDVKEEELLDHDGDVTVTATLGQFRPSVDDQQLLENVKSSSLRVDFVQTESFMNVLAPMAWAALAVFEHNKANKLPTVNQLGYQKTFMDGKILLPGGTGKFAVNVFPLKPESTLHKILKLAIPAALALAPVLNLPAISIPVLKTVTQLYLGPKEEESYGKPLLNSFPVRWSATRRAFAESLEIEKYPLIDGNYIMVPETHAEELSKAFSTLKLQQGFVMQKDASEADSPTTRAMQAIPGVTYVTMNLRVTKVVQTSISTKSVADEPQLQPESSTKKTTSTTPPKSTNPTNPNAPPKKRP